ncbi:hypothetical protein TGGT1_263160 [Toxoplasma gondii GT1]|uniref:Transmembrane protein n=3 Tax=Toxoplasma gondii TaxID=5811 RepID=S7UXY5_TOXGG|nr:hypothetical protein TGGT1_263160 [Toxoplasma gondii GT1]KAF4640978.1 hypothetical protein TGRH88_067860 [Toxoplasma gondii]RQX71535.1 putative transmembrane protein [Toxoplasma gondii CAST]
MVKSRVKKTLARIENGLCSRLDEAPRSLSSACSCQTRPRMPARNFSLLSPAFRGHHRVHGMCSEFEDKGLGLSTRFFCFRLFSLAKNLRDDSRRGSDSGAGEPTHLRRGGRSSQQVCPRQERPSIFFVLTSLSLFFIASSSLLRLFFVSSLSVLHPPLRGGVSGDSFFVCTSVFVEASWGVVDEEGPQEKKLPAASFPAAKQ